MAHDIVLAREVSINGVDYKVGDSLRVSQSIFTRLSIGGYIVDGDAPVEKKPKVTKKKEA